MAANLTDLAADAADARRRLATGKAPATLATAQADLRRAQEDIADVMATMSDADLAAYAASRRATR